MKVSEPTRKIGVFSHGGTKNLGDEALLAAVIQNVRIRSSASLSIRRTRASGTAFPVFRSEDREKLPRRLPWFLLIPQLGNGRPRP